MHPANTPTSDASTPASLASVPQPRLNPSDRNSTSTPSSPYPFQFPPSLKPFCFNPYQRLGLKEKRVRVNFVPLHHGMIPK
ncbi:Protein of unknown function [Pyronema omphalodes CBS 100304]|uniref:Uncharacterized protein n=1 Tax=Pyronema omphalodes (strain CBS 100304) TaxID=1076935 RepID=U4L3R3_PYROM|nr:Protein of unknown function [Pyronema omphalodes CBS 100304]